MNSSIDHNSKKKQTILIIGAGPAGLTAGLETLRNSEIHPIIIEADTQVGGISRTVNYKGNRIDIGGHRFFSKSNWVMNWWKEILPIDPESIDGDEIKISYQGKSTEVTVKDTQQASDETMMVRPRLSRIYYEGNFYDYPIKLNYNTIKNLGLIRMTIMGLSYVKAMLFPVKENNLEDFLTNRFGRKLYETFFESYTEKVWGVPCNKISSEWGAQRIKGLSVGKALMHFILAPFRRKNLADQKKGETSLIERFLYPKYGPGQMWETVANKIIDLGGEIHMQQRVTEIELSDKQVIKVTATDKQGNKHSYRPDWVISTMPVKELAESMSDKVPNEIKELTNHLPYRDFLTVGLLLSKVKPNPQSRSSLANNMPPDNWIYIQDPGVKLGRLQIFNNWSPFMVSDPEKVWVGLEYFCNEGDELWDMVDSDLINFAGNELEKIGIIDHQDILDSVVIRMPKAYPAYFGTYEKFDKIRDYFDTIDNLYLVGRNGMHRYNNQDHSMLAAKACVDGIINNSSDRSILWEVNAEDEYHEEASS